MQHKLNVQVIMLCSRFNTLGFSVSLVFFWVKHLMLVGRKKLVTEIPIKDVAQHRQLVSVFFRYFIITV